jgi:predicted double-glycine peptidase
MLLVQIYATIAGVLTLALIPIASAVGAAATQRSTIQTLALATESKNTAKASATSRSKRLTTKASTIRVTSKSAASVGTLETIAQSLNNCGPSSVAAVLAYWHVYRSEDQVASVLRADWAYWGMSPVDLPAYARSLGLKALVGYGGSEKLVKLLIANGFPVIASQYVSSDDQIRHYRPIESYSDATGTFVSADPYLGANHVISYSEFNAIWAESDYRFQVIYPPSMQARLTAVLKAAGWNRARTFSGAVAWEEAQMHTTDFYSSGSWIAYNGYVDVAYDQAQLGQYRKATATLTLASRAGDNATMIGWVQNEIRYLEAHGSD